MKFHVDSIMQLGKKHCEYCSCDAKILKQEGLESSHLIQVFSQSWALLLNLMLKFVSWGMPPL